MTYIANLSAKMGIVSRKQAMEMSINTGKKLADKSNSINRLVNLQEIEEVFKQTLPERCRPKILTKKEEVVDILVKSGLSVEQAQESVNMPYIGAACVNNGRKQMPIWIPLENFEKLPFLKPLLSSFITHELEHALERNNRPIDIIRRKISGIKKFFGKLFDKNYIQKSFDREMAIHEFEKNIQEELAECLDVEAGGLACEASVEKINEYLTINTGRNLIERLRDIMRKNFACAENQGAETNKRLKLMKNWMAMEQPAYYVQGEIEKYSGVVTGKGSIHEGISRGYEIAKDIASQERKGYWKNMLLGKLKKPNIYSDDSDLLKHANTKKQKQILTKIFKDLDKKQKDGLIKILYSHEKDTEIIETLAKFLERTTVKNKNVYLDFPMELENIDTKTLLNPIFIKIAKLANSDVKNAKMIISLLPSLAGANPLDLRICLGKLQKAIKKEKDISNMVDKILCEFYTKQK